MHFVQGDFTLSETQEKLIQKLKEVCPPKSEEQPSRFDAILSDMAPNYSGDKQTDHIRLIVSLFFIEILITLTEHR
jgi:23S rRNA U2552 (ribose-2'-O)-methylase RlmE/FtsJ